jgi:hypothetical protein
MADPISEREDLGRVLELAARAAERYLGALDVEPAAPPGIDEAGRRSAAARCPRPATAR